jgi:hypothetical protein
MQMISMTRQYADMSADELMLFDRDFANIARMYSSQEKDNLIQLWTGTEFSGLDIQPVIQKASVEKGPDLTEKEFAILGTDKAQALLHLGFFKKTQDGKTYLGRHLDQTGIGMDVIRPEDYFGVNSNFTLWDQPTGGWTAMPPAQREVRTWADLGNPDNADFVLAPVEIVTMDANDDKWALLIFGLMELTNSTDVYAFHWQTNRKPRPPAVLENQIRVGDIGYARFGPIYIDHLEPYATGLEFRGDAAFVPVASPKLWGLCFFTNKRALAEPRTRARAA